MNALNIIYDDLMRGNAYGKYCNNVKYPYFEYSIYYDDLKKVLCWHHFGCGANRASRDELKWIIEVIFEMTPEKFLKIYVRKEAKA